MKLKTLTIMLLVSLVIVSCTPAIAATPHTNQGPPQSELDSTSLSTTIQDSMQEPPQEPTSDSNVGGMHFAGQGPTTFPIRKDPGMVLLHLKVEDCGSLVISGKGQNIPYLSSTLPSQPGQFEDQYQYYNVFQGSPDRSQTIILDRSSPYEDYDAPPHTEMLRIEEVSEECKWEASILPMSAAKSISPGQTRSGEYSDVLAVTGGLRAIELLFMSPGHDRMLQDFRSIVAVTNNGLSQLEESLDQAGLYDNIPSGTMYLVFSSNGYWELQGK